MPIIDTVEHIGALNGITKTNIWGVCQDQNYRLVALYVSGGPTATNAIRARLSDEKGAFRMTVKHTHTPERSLYVHNPKEHKYRTFVNNIPGTHINTLIAVSERLDDNAHIDGEMVYSYFWDDQYAAMRLYLRVKALVDVYVDPKWADYLLLMGKNEYVGRYTLCGSYTQMNKKESNYWMCAGFKIGYMQTNKQAWTQIITEGLKTNRIWEK